MLVSSTLAISLSSTYNLAAFWSGWRDFAAACGERGILCQMRDIIRSYRQGYSMEQLSLF